MKLHLDNAHGEFRISGYSASGIVVNDVTYEGALVVRTTHPPQPWTIDNASSLAREHFADLLALRPEVLLLGTGDAQHFPPVEIMSAFYEQHIGFEVMDSRAACRTFNILASEGRTVVAALLPVSS